ncbi:MAG: ribonuclease P protein component [Gammaproteobacteria bacterium]|nr:ribonuclease P protein component [Pseudomonadota bacterium]MCH9663143.1 ribonuclease P protein component [Gammaproteobacteria bacterium]
MPSLRSRRFRQTEIAAVIKHGHKLHARCSSLKWSPGEAGITRLAFSVSRRHARLSVKRNYIKRCHREAARAVELSQLASGHDIVVFSKPAIADLTRAQIRQDAQDLWKKFASSRAKSSSG